MLISKLRQRARKRDRERDRESESVEKKQHGEVEQVEQLEYTEGEEEPRECDIIKA